MSQTPPDMTNPENVAEQKKYLNISRFRMGLANLFFSGEESSLAGQKIMIVKYLGGTDKHIGLISSFGSFMALTQWIALPLLQKFQSNRKAQAAALSIGVLSGTLLAISVAFGNAEGMQNVMLWLFLASTLLMTIATGVQITVETNWIGDLVPQNLRGWFTSVKSVVSLIGMISLGLFFGWVIDNYGKGEDLCITSMWLYLLVAFSHIMAIALIWKVPDRKPQPVGIFSKDKTGGKLNYKSYALWCYIIFYLIWSSGRGITFTFQTPFLLDRNMSLLGINSLMIFTNLISMAVLLILGKVADKKGNRLPLMGVSVFVGLAILLWPASEWLGIGSIIAYYIINGMAGATHTMLAMNFGLELFPAKGRAAYLAFSRLLLGIGSLVIINTTAWISDSLRESSWTFELFGKTLGRYDLMFLISSFIVCCSFIPLLAVGKHVVEEK